MKNINDVQAMTMTEDRVWEVIQSLSELKARKFAIWCARQANRDNVPEVTKFLDAVEAFHIFGTTTKKELDAHRAEYCAAYKAATENPEYWTVHCPAFRASDWAAYKVAHWGAYNAAYWAATYNAADWEAQIEYLSSRRCA